MSVMISSQAYFELENKLFRNRQSILHSNHWIDIHKLRIKYTNKKDVIEKNTLWIDYHNALINILMEENEVLKLRIKNYPIKYKLSKKVLKDEV